MDVGECYQYCLFNLSAFSRIKVKLLSLEAGTNMLPRIVTFRRIDMLSIGPGAYPRWLLMRLIPCSRHCVA
jgi:hypothetical protein